MKKTTASAPGKLMLLGEHAVVYGQPCLVTAVDSRLEVTVEPTTVDGVTIDAPQVKDTRFVESAIKIFNRNTIKLSSPITVGDQGSHLLDSRLRGNDKKNKGIKITTHSPFSGKFGFGSSSAVTVATLKALSLYYNQPLSKQELFDVSYEVVMQVQGTGSGFDVAAASFGGTLYFKKGGAVLESMAMPWNDITLVVGYSGVKSNTVELIKQVAQLRDTYPQKFDRLMHSVGDLVDQARKALIEKDWQRLGTLMDFNQEFLRDMGVSTDILEKPIVAAKKAGAYGAKLSGAGGGDCMIALTSKENKAAVETAISQDGGTVIAAELNAEGAREELQVSSSSLAAAPSYTSNPNF